VVLAYRADLIRGPLSHERVLRKGDRRHTRDGRRTAARTARQLTSTAYRPEINPGSLLNREQVMNSLRLYCQVVMSQFKQ
jgi:hypothetical protein